MNSFTRIGLRSRFLLVLMIGLILPTLSVWGQNATITGKVVDPKGEPLVGVSVLEQGTTNGTVTDMNGRYSIVVRKTLLLFDLVIWGLIIRKLFRENVGLSMLH